MAITINQDWVTQNQNQNIESGLGYLAKSKGALRSLLVAQKVVRLGGEIGNGLGCQPNEVLKALDSNLGIGVGALGFPRLPSVSSTLIKSLSNLWASEENRGIPFQKRAVKAVRDTLDAISAYGYAANFIKFNPVVKTVTQGADFVFDTIDLPVAYSDYQKAAALEDQVEGAVKEALSHSKNYYLLSVAKAVLSIALFALSLLIAFLGASTLTSMAAISLSLVVTVLAIDRDFHESSGPYQIIKFDREVQV